LQSPSEDGNKNVVLLEKVYFTGPPLHLLIIYLTLIDISRCTAIPQELSKEEAVEEIKTGFLL
jgi:hypothetical protein